MQFTPTHDVEDILNQILRRVRAIEFTFTNLAKVAGEADNDDEADAYDGYAEATAEIWPRSKD
jgi:hypothetical protein